MNLENIQKVENLIKERNSLIEFKAKSAENVGDRIIVINDVKFEAEFLRPIYSQGFVKEMNELIIKMCDGYIGMIDGQLSEL